MQKRESGCRYPPRQDTIFFLFFFFFFKKMIPEIQSMISDLTLYFISLFYCDQLNEPPELSPANAVCKLCAH